MSLIFQAKIVDQSEFSSTIWMLLLTGLFSCVQAQWMLDNRCFFGNNNRRLKDLTAWNASHFSLSAEARNATAEDKLDWYSHLRGGESHRKQRSLAIQDTDPNSFMMKLHWEEGYCWQGEMLERRWCMQCESRMKCAAGDKLWTQFCDNSVGQKFVWVPNVSVPDRTTNYGQLKMAYFDLCLERMTTNIYMLQKCDAQSAYQVIVGWHPKNPFELHPVENRDKCINQQQDPKPEEEITNTSCDTAEKLHTNLWEVYFNDNAANEIANLRNPRCSSISPCKKCFGACQTDDDCEAGLICLRRTADDGYAPIPGCQGFPSPGADYCYQPENFLMPKEFRNDGLRLRTYPCTKDIGCNACEGVCNDDSLCVGNLKCKLRGNDGPTAHVSGCIGDGVPESGYCYDPQAPQIETQRNRLQLRNRQCSENYPCFQCYGGCENDSHCYGPLKCFQRNANSPSGSVPGCVGVGEPGADYCYMPGDAIIAQESSAVDQGKTHVPTLTLTSTAAPILPPSKAPTLSASDAPIKEENRVTASPSAAPVKKINESLTNQDEEMAIFGPEIPLDRQIRVCSRFAPCDECMGDCQEDSDCKGDMICFQREWYDPFRKVKGCSGRGVAGASYCVYP